MSLAATVYGWWAKRPQRLRKLSTIGRIVPIALALLSTILLQLEFTHKSFTIYFLIANAQRESLSLPLSLSLLHVNNSVTQSANTSARSGPKSGGLVHLPFNDIVQIRPNTTPTQDMAVDSVRTARIDSHVRRKECTQPSQPDILWRWQTECHL